jgi:hypothetical protein
LQRLKKNTIKNRRRRGKPATGKSGRRDASKKLDAAEKMGQICTQNPKSTD